MTDIQACQHTTNLVEIGIECGIVSIVELCLFIKNIGQVLVTMSLQRFLG